MQNLLRVPYSNRVFGLDVLRAFAILTVMVGHSEPLVGKFLLPYYHKFVYDGVSIFFVLSGFLIGGILIRTLETKPASFWVLLDFWVKRWFRTVPLYLLVLLIILGLTAAQSSDFHLTYYKRYFVFLQNLNWPHPNFFLESWSLPVEEAFYLLTAPAIFLLVVRRLRPRTAVAVVALAVLVSVTFYRYYKFIHMPPHTIDVWDLQFRKTVLTRLDALMYGVLGAYAAYYFPAFWKQHKKTKLALGIALLVLHRFVFPAPDTLYVSVFSFSVASLGALLLLPFLSEWRTQNGIFARVTTHVSLISYSLYLLHLTLILGMLIYPHMASLPGTVAEQHLAGMLAFWGLSFFLATLMHKYFEVPITKLRTRIRMAPVPELIIPLAIEKA